MRHWSKNICVNETKFIYYFYELFVKRTQTICKSKNKFAELTHILYSNDASNKANFFCLINKFVIAVFYSITEFLL